MSVAATAPRRAAFEVLRRVFEHDAWADRAFPAAAERHGLEGRERGQAQALAYGAVQRKGTADHFIAELTGKRVSKLDAPVIAALRLGLFEILYSEGADHAAVNGAVELAKGGISRGGSKRAAGAGGLVNAVLRRAIREREELLAKLSDETSAQAALAHSVPDWLAAMWWDELGAESARSLLRALNDPPETAMRTNTLRIDVVSLREELEAGGEPLEPAASDIDVLHPPEALVWRGPLGHAALEALADGRMFAQSRGAQAVVELLAPRAGERVLDLCAGPGAKTVAIAARVGMDGEVVAVERDPGRARQVDELCARAGAENVRVVCADAAQFDTAGRGYDRVLVDPPCSDLGTLASRPDARWRKDPDGVARLSELQAKILATGTSAVRRPGGTVVYSTCTISKRENEAVIDTAMSAHPALEESSRLAVRPDRDRTDGFFIARLEAGAGV